MEIEVESRIRVDAETLWMDATSPVGINRELNPYISMSFPRDLKQFGYEGIPYGRVLFVSWLSLFGFFPFDRHRVGLTHWAPGHFIEQSSSWLQKSWRHERQVIPCGDSTSFIRDRVSVTPRLPFASAMTRFFVSAVFRHRHNRLRRHYGVV